MVEAMEEDMTVIIKVIAEVEVVSEEEVMEEVITNKPKIKIREIIKPKVTKIKLKIKIIVIMQSSPLVIITKDREEVHSAFIVKGVVLISTTGYINVIGWKQFLMIGMQIWILQATKISLKI